MANLKSRIEAAVIELREKHGKDYSIRGVLTNKGAHDLFEEVFGRQPKAGDQFQHVSVAGEDILLWVPEPETGKQRVVMAEVTHHGDEDLTVRIVDKIYL